jgi:hypothetical protein
MARRARKPSCRESNSFAQAIAGEIETMVSIFAGDFHIDRRRLQGAPR